MPTCRRLRGGGEGGEVVREAWRQQQLWWQRWRCCDFLSLGENGGWAWGHQESSLLFVFRAEYKQRVSLELKCCCFEIHWPWPPWQKINDMQNHQLIKTFFFHQIKNSSWMLLLKYGRLRKRWKECVLPTHVCELVCNVVANVLSSSSVFDQSCNVFFYFSSLTFQRFTIVYLNFSF